MLHVIIHPKSSTLVFNYNIEIYPFHGAGSGKLLINKRLGARASLLFISCTYLFFAFLFYSLSFLVDFLSNIITDIDGLCIDGSRSKSS